MSGLDRLPLRTILTVTFLAVFVPAGHIAAPIALFFLRFMNPQYSITRMDAVIGCCTLLGLGLALTSWLKKRLALSLLAAVFFGVSLALAWWEWADPRDATTPVTSIPFLVTTCAIAWAVCRPAKSGE